MEIDVQNNSGLGKGSELPQEVRHFNWSAFFITWIWGVFRHCLGAYFRIYFIEIVPRKDWKNLCNYQFYRGNCSGVRHHSYVYVNLVIHLFF